MADPAGIKVKGYKSLIRAMKDIGVPANVINAAGKEAGQLVLNEAKSLVPVRSGALRNTIRLSATAKGVSIKAGNERSVQYANPIHWGWFKRYIKPQPFFSKALGYSRDEIYQRYFTQLESFVTQKMNLQNKDIS